MTTTNPLYLIGAPTSAGAYGPGQEAAPAKWRHHGLSSALEAAGRSVVDVGDVARAVFREDPDHPDAANVEIVADMCRAVARHMSVALSRGADVLVLGGDCTVQLGSLAGALTDSRSVGLVYIDGDTDLNTPETGDGILDWMGVAHILGLPGVRPELADLATRSPMLEPDAIRFVAADNTNAAEQRLVDELRLHRYSLTECLDAPDAVVASIGQWAAQFERLLVHVDIDVLDGAAFPLADNDRTIPGLPLPALGGLLEALCHLPNFAALTLCEVNPDRAIDEDAQFAELISLLVAALR